MTSVEQLRRCKQLDRQAKALGFVAQAGYTTERIELVPTPETAELYGLSSKARWAVKSVEEGIAWLQGFNSMLEIVQLSGRYTRKEVENEG